MMCGRFMNNLALVLFLAFFVAACTSSRPPLDYIGPNMVDGPSVKAQREMRMPPKGTVPADFEPYPFQKDEGERAGKVLRNPLRPTKATLLRGQKLYETFCLVCHGTRGDGAGPIVPKFPQPPPLFSEKVSEWPDGRIFHVITRGQNLMSSYASQVTAEERWTIVHYLRVLQRAAHPTDADLKRLK